VHVVERWVIAEIALVAGELQILLLGLVGVGACDLGTER
jgi:hypothetical protein